MIPHNRILLYTAVVICIMFGTSCTNSPKRIFQKPKFQTAILLPHTPPKSQGEWPAGWIYATLALIESERISAGDSLELSETYLIRKFLEENVNNGRCDSTFSGNPFSCLRLLERQGLITYQCYRNRPTINWPDFRRLASKRNLQVICDTGFAYLPKTIGLYGASYTPHDLMESLFIRNNYIGFISDASFPLGQQVQCTFPGDRQEETYFNLSQASLIRIIEQSLYKGHTLVWMGDTTETCYSGEAGYAYWPSGSDNSQQARMQGLAAKKTTPDHCMQIIGKAYAINEPSDKDAKPGNTYYICKNSAGSNPVNNGLFYLSADYIKMKTVALYRHR